MDVGMVIGAAAFGVAAMVLFWNQPIKAQLKVFSIAIFVVAVMVAVRLLFTQNGVSLLTALTDPPYWKLLAAVAAIFGLGVSILRSLIFKRVRKK